MVIARDIQIFLSMELFVEPLPGAWVKMCSLAVDIVMWFTEECSSVVNSPLILFLMLFINVFMFIKYFSFWCETLI